MNKQQTTNKMNKSNNIQYVGTHDYDKENAITEGWNITFSVGIFKWELKNDGKSMKKGKTIVRVSGLVSQKEKVFDFADKVVDALNNNEWDGRKNVRVK